MAFYQPQLTPVQTAELIRDLHALSHKYHLSKHDLLDKFRELIQAPGVVPVPMPSPKVEVPVPGQGRKGSRWTPEEEVAMATSFAAGETCDVIAKKLERTNTAIASRMALYVSKSSKSKDIPTLVQQFHLSGLNEHDMSTFLTYLRKYWDTQAVAATVAAATGVTMEAIPPTPSPTPSPPRTTTPVDDAGADDPE